MDMQNRNGDLERVQYWLKHVRAILMVLEHAKAHLQEVADDRDALEYPVPDPLRPTPAKVQAPEPVPAPAPAPVPAPAPEPGRTPGSPRTPTERINAAIQAAGYAQQPPDAPRIARGRTFVSPGLKQAIIDGARRRPKPTIAMLAHEFDVSMATVSRLLRNRFNPPDQAEDEAQKCPDGTDG
jgi:hypothetical protein